MTQSTRSDRETVRRTYEAHLARARQVLRAHGVGFLGARASWLQRLLVALGWPTPLPLFAPFWVNVCLFGVELSVEFAVFRIFWDWGSWAPPLQHAAVALAGGSGTALLFASFLHWRARRANLPAWADLARPPCPIEA